MFKFLIRYKFLFLLIITVLAILAGRQIPSIEVNTDFSQFLPDNDPEYLFHKKLKSEIKDDESIIIVGIENNPTVYDSAFIMKTSSFIDSLNQVDGVYHIRALTNVSYPVRSLLGILSMPYLPVMIRSTLIITGIK